MAREETKVKEKRAEFLPGEVKGSLSRQ